MRRNDFFKYLLLGGGGSASRSELESEILPYTFVSKSQRLKDYRIYGNTVDGESVGDLVETGEHTGEYLVPMTVNDTTTDLYLPEPLKMVGGKAEYVDFREQKQHRVRKNLLQNIATSQTNSGVTFTVNENGSITCNGTSTSRYYSYIEIPILLLPGQYRLNGCPLNGESNTYRAEFRENGSTIIESIDIGNGAIFTVSSEAEGSYFIRIQGNYTVENKTFYPMIRKADIIDDTYEPYIENTELDVTLPALPTLSGTNTLSVGTTVQPSKIWIQGNISEIETASVQALQANMRSLQPLSLDDEDLEIDVMPTDNDLQLDVKPIEKPVLNLNNVSEIENAEIERGIESAE